MMKQFATILMLVGACLAFPAEEEQRPSLPAQLPAELPQPNQESQPQLELLPEQTQPGLEQVQPGLEQAQSGLEQAQPGLDQAQPGQEQAPGEPQNPKDTDLKTDATFWWGRSYPFAYRRSYSYYRPRSYSYYTPYYHSRYYAPYYNYWNSYW